MNFAGKLFSTLKSAVGQSGRGRSRTANRFHSARRMQMEPLERRELLSVDGFVGTIYSPSPEAGEYFGNYVETLGNDLVVSTTDGTSPMAYRINPATGDVVQTYTPPETGAHYDIAVLSDNVVMRGATVSNPEGATDEHIFLFDGDSGEVLETFIVPNSYNAGSLPGSMAEYHTTDAEGNALNLLLFPETMTSIDEGSGDIIAAGAVYVFDMDSGGEPLATIENPTPAPGEMFGLGIAVQDSTIYITTDGAETTYDNYGNPQCEVMYAFDASDPDPALWQPVHTFMKEEPANSFNEYIGNSLMLYDDRLYVGDSSNDLDGSESGVVHVFETYTTSTADELDGEPLGTWDNPTPQSGDFFGFSLATLNGNILVGSPRDQTTGVMSGSVYVYSPDGDLRDVYIDPTPGEFDMFGRDIAIAGDFIAFSDGGDDTNGDNAGAVQLFSADSTVIYVSDAAGLLVSEDGATTDTFNVVLSEAPTADVTVNFSVSDPTEASLDVTTLTFTTSNWDTAQTVTITGVDDGLADGDQTFTIDFDPAISTDTDYDGYQLASVSVTCLDAMTVTQTFSTGPVNLAIPDPSGRTAGHLVSELEVTEAGTIRDLNLQLDITHPTLYGIYVSLESPGGVFANVINGDLSSNADLPGTILDDEAGNVIDRSDAPFDGTFSPEEPLSVFDGQEIQGTWKLHVWDAGKDKTTGTLNEWSLFDTRYTMAQPPVPNDAPVADDDSYTVDEDGTLTVDATSGVLAHDTDPDAGPDAMTAQLDTPPAHGSLTLDADGSFTYTPDGDFNGSDSFTYVANDGQDNSNVATVTLTVNPIADAPVAGNDAVSTDIDAAIVINKADLLSNDSDADGDALSMVSLGTASNGTVIDNGDGTVTYTPSSGFEGDDTFTYTISDGDPGTSNATATVTVTVSPVSTATIHIADLDGSSSAVNKKKWAATVTILVEDGSGSPISGATIEGSWSTGILSTVTTDASGLANVYSGNVDNSVSSVTLTVDSITHATLTYDPGANTDPDGDSSGTSIEVFQDGGTAAPLEATATDAALAALFDFDSTDEEGADPLATQAADELAWMMME